MHFLHRALLFAAFLSLVSCLNAAGVEFERIWPGYRDAASFTGIGEYFGGSENTRGRTVLRSTPGERAGFYWLIRTKGNAPTDHATLRIEFRRPGTTTVETQSFPFQLPARSRPIYAGLTGADWPDATTRPTAWRIQLLNADGTVLAEQSSFLWRDPITATTR